MGRGRTIIHNYLDSPDTLAAIVALRSMGASIDIQGSSLEIDGLKGKIEQIDDVIHVGNSGILLRFLTALGSLSAQTFVITGDHSIRHHRPMSPLLEGLSQLGVSCQSMRNNGFAPVIIQGPLQSGKAYLNGEDSQPVSALLIASAFARGPIELSVQNPGEKPWVSLTLDWLKKLGISCQNHDFTSYRLEGNAHYEGFEYTVPGDFSSAAFPIGAALITQSALTLNNIDMEDVQGDKEIISVFQKMGAKFDYDQMKKKLHVKRGNNLKGIKVDINDFIDAIPLLSVVACFADGETRITNGSNARHKECDRLKCMTLELSKMGADICETEDGLKIRKSQLQGADVHSHQDHRMAMSLAVAGLGARGTTNISSVECVSKTFSHFLSDFQALGAEIV